VHGTNTIIFIGLFKQTFPRKFPPADTPNMVSFLSLPFMSWPQQHYVVYTNQDVRTCWKLPSIFSLLRVVGVLCWGAWEFLFFQLEGKVKVRLSLARYEGLREGWTHSNKHSNLGTK